MLRTFLLVAALGVCLASPACTSGRYAVTSMAAAQARAPFSLAAARHVPRQLSPLVRIDAASTAAAKLILPAKFFAELEAIVQSLVEAFFLTAQTLISGPLFTIHVPPPTTPPATTTSLFIWPLGNFAFNFGFSFNFETMGSIGPPGGRSAFHIFIFI